MSGSVLCSETRLELFRVTKSMLLYSSLGKDGALDGVSSNYCFNLQFKHLELLLDGCSIDI